LNERLTNFLLELLACAVPPAEEYFQIDEYFYAARNKPSIVINLQEIVTVHTALIETTDVLTANPQDPIRILLSELGSPPNIQDDDRAHSQEINLTLVNRFSEFIDSDFSTRQLFIESKKLVFTIIRVQTGKNLIDVLEKPSTEKEERLYAQILDADRANNARRRSRAFSMPQNSLDNLERRGSL
jgi:Ras GTPase-activating-like protein IQGAP2/3